MVNPRQDRERLLTLRDESDLVVIRRHVRELGLLAGLTAVAIEALATAVTEIARNGVLHADSGQVSLRALRGSRGGVERDLVSVVVSDQGPGIGDVGAAMADGYSTAHTLGMGLSGARRLVDAFELTSVVGQGTTVSLEKWAPVPPTHL